MLEKKNGEKSRIKIKQNTHIRTKNSLRFFLIFVGMEKNCTRKKRARKINKHRESLINAHFHIIVFFLICLRDD